MGNLGIGIGVGLQTKPNGIIVLDDFNRANNSLTMGKAKTGQNWIQTDDGVWGINNNQAYAVKINANMGRTLIESKVKNFIFNCDCINITATMRLIFRHKNNDNEWFLDLDPVGKVINLYKRINVTSTLVGRMNFDLTKSISFEILCSGNYIKIKANNVIIFNIIDDYLNESTIIGLSTLGYVQYGSLRWDNFKVVKI